MRMGFWKRRWLAKKLKPINLEFYHNKESGEYKALRWLKANLKTGTFTEPMELIRSMLSCGHGLSKDDVLFVETLLRYS